MDGTTGIQSSKAGDSNHLLSSLLPQWVHFINFFFFFFPPSYELLSYIVDSSLKSITHCIVHTNKSVLQTVLCHCSVVTLTSFSPAWRVSPQFHLLWAFHILCHLAVQWGTRVVEWGTLGILQAFASSLLDGAYWGEVRFTSFSSHLSSFSFCGICSDFFPHTSHCLTDWWAWIITANVFPGVPLPLLHIDHGWVCCPLRHKSRVLFNLMVPHVLHGTVMSTLWNLPCVLGLLFGPAAKEVLERTAQLSESWTQETDLPHGSFRSGQCCSLFQHPQRFHQPCMSLRWAGPCPHH